jgi:hypothetical protein
MIVRPFSIMACAPAAIRVLKRANKTYILKN